MSPAKPFEYDAFISYSSADRAWAKLLADELTARRLEIFFDRDSLKHGEPWETQLEESLDASQHLIVLWSKHSSDNPEYVGRERALFNYKARPSASEPNQTPRREIVIVLEEPVTAVHSGNQMIMELKDAGAYAKGVDNLDRNVWSEVVRKVEKTIRDDPNTQHILVAVLAAPRKSIEALDFNKLYARIGTLNDILPQMGIRSKDDLLAYYGEGPDDWCPFGDKEKIWTVLDKLKKAVLEVTGEAVVIDWEPIGSDLWSNHPEAAEREAARLIKEPSMVIIDPISLMDDDVRAALDLISDCFANTRSAIMVLTPFKMLEPSASLRMVVEGRARSLWSLFYKPHVPPSSPSANFGTNVSDLTDMRRLVLVTLGQYVGARKGPNEWMSL